MKGNSVLGSWLNYVIVPTTIPTVSLVTDIYLKSPTPILFTFSFILISLYTFLFSCSIYKDIKRSVIDPSLVPLIHEKSKFINPLLTIVSSLYILHLTLLPSPSLFVIIPYIVLLFLTPPRYIVLSYLSTIRYIGKKPTRGVSDVVVMLTEVGAAVASYITTHWLVSAVILIASFITNIDLLFETHGNGGNEDK